MNSHVSAGEERTGGFEGRVGGTELGDSQQEGVNVLKERERMRGGAPGGSGDRLLVARVNAHGNHHRKTTKPVRKLGALLADRLANTA